MSSPSAFSPDPIDPRGSRFGAAVAAILLAPALVAGPRSVVSLLLLAVQTVAYATGAMLGLKAQLWGVVYRRWVRPRLGPPAELKDPRPQQFALSIGLGLAFAGLTGWVLGQPALFYPAISLALMAALLNAVFDRCLGCELYLWVKRVPPRVPAGAAS